MSEKINYVSSEVLNETCPAVGYQQVNVCVPVTVTPYAHTGATKTKFCGDPRVMPWRTEWCMYLHNQPNTVY